MNRVSLTGRITKDPEIRYAANNAGMSFLSFSLAVDSTRKDANGQRQADFISCTAFGQQADFMSRYIKKGYMLAVSGRLQSRTYTDQTGATRYTMDVIVDQVENLTPRDITAAPQQQAGYQNNQYGNNNANRAPQYNQNQGQYNGYNNPSYGQPAPQQSYRPQDIQQPAQTETSSIDIDDTDYPF